MHTVQIQSIASNGFLRRESEFILSCWADSWFMTEHILLHSRSEILYTEIQVGILSLYRHVSCPQTELVFYEHPKQGSHNAKTSQFIFLCTRLDSSLSLFFLQSEKGRLSEESAFSCAVDASIVRKIAPLFLHPRDEHVWRRKKGHRSPLWRAPPRWLCQLFLQFGCRKVMTCCFYTKALCPIHTSVHKCVRQAQLKDF